jgi:hypothetical protein
VNATFQSAIGVDGLMIIFIFPLLRAARAADRCDEGRFWKRTKEKVHSSALSPSLISGSRRHTHPIRLLKNTDALPLGA